MNLFFILMLNILVMISYLGHVCSGLSRVDGWRARGATVATFSEFALLCRSEVFPGMSTGTLVMAARMLAHTGMCPCCHSSSSFRYTALISIYKCAWLVSW